MTVASRFKDLICHRRRDPVLLHPRMHTVAADTTFFPHGRTDSLVRIVSHRPDTKLVVSHISDFIRHKTLSQVLPRPDDRELLLGTEDVEVEADRNEFERE